MLNGVPWWNLHSPSESNLFMSENKKSTERCTVDKLDSHRSIKIKYNKNK